MNTVAYRKRGESGAPVVWIHGWMMSSQVFDPFLESLKGPALQAILPDLRGAGESSTHGGDISIASFAEDVLSVLDREGLESAALVGHSMGGKVAQWLAIHHPERVKAMFLLCPVPACAMALPGEVTEMFRSSGGNREAQGKILDMACIALPPELRKSLLDLAGAISPDAIAAGFDAWAKEDFAADLAQVTTPTTVVASDDPFLPLDFLKTSLVDPIGNGTIEHVAGAGHYVHLEAPEPAGRHFANWLAALP